MWDAAGVYLGEVQQSLASQCAVVQPTQLAALAIALFTFKESNCASLLRYTLLRGTIRNLPCTNVTHQALGGDRRDHEGIQRSPLCGKQSRCGSVHDNVRSFLLGALGPFQAGRVAAARWVHQLLSLTQVAHP